MYLLCIEPPDGGLPDILKLQKKLVKKNDLLPVWYPWLPLAVSEKVFDKKDYEIDELKKIEPFRCSRIKKYGHWIILEDERINLKNLVRNDTDIFRPLGKGFIMGKTEHSVFSDVPAQICYRSWKLMCHKLTIPEGHQPENGGMWDMMWRINVRSLMN